MSMLDPIRNEVDEIEQKMKDLMREIALTDDNETQNKLVDEHYDLRRKRDDLRRTMGKLVKQGLR